MKVFSSVLFIVLLMFACREQQTPKSTPQKKSTKTTTFIDTLNGVWNQQKAGCDIDWKVCDTVISTWKFQDSTVHYNDFEQVFYLSGDTLFISKEPYVMRKKSGKTIYLENTRTKNRMILDKKN